MPEWLADILQWIRMNPEMAGLTIGVVAFLEGLAIVGILIPGIIILFGFGTLIGLGILDLGPVWVWCSVGAIIGDGISFWLGYHFKERLRGIWPFNRYADLIQQGEQFFKRHGLKSILIGRFVGPVRPVMPVVAGMLGMDVKRYIPANILAGILWAPAYLLPGVVFGASIELAKAVALRLALLIVFAGGLAWILTWLIRSSYRYLAPRTSRMLAFAMRWSQRHPLLGRFTRPLVDPSVPESGSLALFALTLILTACGLVYFAIALPMAGGVFEADQQILSFFSNLRTPWADPAMLFVSGLGDYPTLISAASAVTGWLLWRKRKLALNHWVAAVLFGLALTLGIEQVVRIASATRDTLPLSDNIAMTHLTLSVVVYGFFAVLISRELPNRNRIWPYVAAVLLVFSIAFSRLYFATHRPSDMITGLLAAAFWVAILGIAYRRRIRRNYWMVPPTFVFFIVALAASIATYISRTPTTLTVHQPIPEMTMTKEVWLREGLTPQHLSSTLSERWQALSKAYHNIEISGDLPQIEQIMAEQGWINAKPLSWSFVFEMLQPEPTVESLTLLPASYLSRREALVMHKTDPQSGQLQVFRLWPSSTQLENGTRIWLGRIHTADLQQLLYFFSYWGESAISQQQLTDLTSHLPGSSLVTSGQDKTRLLIEME